MLYEYGQGKVRNLQFRSTQLFANWTGVKNRIFTTPITDTNWTQYVFNVTATSRLIHGADYYYNGTV